ncbi:putative disease resistance protein RGA1 [Cannabis sativa]|nr:putative disease resistance protein RGA1 [Cannabis sativa]
MSLEGLQPHQNIQNLMLTNYGGVKLSGWLLSLTNLVELTLKDCAKCEYLVPLNQFKCLKHLKLERLICLEYISNTNSVSEDLVGSTTTLLPSLETLELLDLPNLKGWWREIEVDHSCFDANANANEDNHTSLPYYLPSLSKLTIRDCPKLTCMPLYPRLEGKLQLNKTSWKPLEETLRMRMMYLTTPSFSPLSKLERLYLTDIDDLECLPDSFKSLACLSRFHIDGCPKLKDLCPGILHLSSLRRLWISRCERLGDMLISDDYDSMWQALNVTLQSLGLCKLPNIVTVLPRGIQHLTSLQQLEVFKCDSLTTIPEWINNLKSLKSLWLYDCPNLTSFPEGIRSLTTLNLLYIDSCPMLLKRCKRNTGEDWDKISHIEDLTLIPDANKEEENEGCNLLNKFRLRNTRNEG